MVAQLTYGVRKFENSDKEMREIIPVLKFNLKINPNYLMQTECNCNDYMEALKLPKNSGTGKDFVVFNAKWLKKGCRSAFKYYEIR